MNLSNLLVVLVEPSKTQRSIIRKHLAFFEINEVEECLCGQEALDFMASQVPDIVISSMHLPDMTGTDIVSKMRDNDLLQSTTFLLISSETHYRFLEPVRQAGAIGILPKPFTNKELGKVLHSTLDYIGDYESEFGDEEFEALSVLIVDDSRVSRTYFKNILKNLGVKSLVEAEDGAEALDIFQKQHFDLVVTDYNMPNVDGMELLEHIRKDKKQPEVPVMMVTSEQNKASLAAIESAGVSALLKKPLSYEVIKRIITELVLN
ncbi:MAG: response regulator [Pseudomonadales bacterium]|nr:response regulator [Pseudomonadales bacterium]NRA14431.1 response regulator [Oceanospirillaceae bacterium]